MLLRNNLLQAQRASICLGIAIGEQLFYAKSASLVCGANFASVWGFGRPCICLPCPGMNNSGRYLYQILPCRSVVTISPQRDRTPRPAKSMLSEPSIELSSIGPWNLEYNPRLPDTFPQTGSFDHGLPHVYENPTNTPAGRDRRH
jgi:hypothetical protein